MKALISGIAGFAGSHLAEHLLAAGWEVSGLDRRDAARGNLEAVAGAVRVTPCDIIDPREVSRAVADSGADVLFHLAAVTFVPSAESAPHAAFEVNVKGTLNILEGCASLSPRPLVILVSSAEVYGRVPVAEMPLTEESPARPANIYALTKLCAEELAHFYHRAGSIPVMVLRPFNHVGPRQSRAFAASSFAFQIAEIEAGRREPVLRVGNLDAARDFTDVRDVVRAYRLAAERCAPGSVYNICSGRHYPIRDILERLLKLARLPIEVRTDPGLLRRSEIPLFYGDSSRFRRVTGWEPAYGIDATLKNILDYWRDRARAARTDAPS